MIDLAAGRCCQDDPGRAAALPPREIAVDPKSPAPSSQREPGHDHRDRHEALTVARTLSVERPQGIGTSPTYLSVTPDGCDLLSADSGEDAVAVFALSTAKSCGQTGKTQKKTAAVRRPQPRTPPGEASVKHKRNKRRGAAGARSSSSAGSRRAPIRRWPPRRRSAASSSGSPPVVWGSARTRNGPNPNHRRTTTPTYQYLPSIVDGASGVLTYPERPEDPQAHPGQRSAGDPADAPSAAAGHPDPGRRPDQARLLHRPREPNLRPGPRRRLAGRRRPCADPLRQIDHAEPARARPAIPAARPCLCELRGLDRRPLLDGGGSRLRLRDEELASELCGPQPTLRLRLLRSQRPAQGLHLPAHARVEVSRSTTTARRLRVSHLSRTRTGRRERPPRTPRSSI